MRRIGLLAACLALAATACTPLVNAVTGGPGTVANKTVLDEQVGLTLTLAYTAASRAAGLAISTGLVKDHATIVRIGQLDSKAYAAVQAVRAAYVAANSASYLSGAVTGPAGCGGPSSRRARAFGVERQGATLCPAGRRRAGNQGSVRYDWRGMGTAAAAGYSAGGRRRP
jgi:hypothetical protein